MESAVQVVPCGEAAARVLPVTGTAEERWAAVHALAAWVNTAGIPGVHGGVPTYDSVLVEFDAALVSFDVVRFLVTSRMSDAAAGTRQRTVRTFEVPTVYGGPHGPDLPFIADLLGICERDVIDLHAAKTYTVRCLGGPAGSAMFDGPDFPRPIPRLPDPRLEVPANAVSVAGVQGVLGPVRGPSGWRLIGLTPVQVMNLGSAALVPYRPGDRVRFRPITADEWDRHAGRHLEPLKEETRWS